MLKVSGKKKKQILFIIAGILVFNAIFTLAVKPFLAKNELLNKEIRVTRLKFKQYLGLLSRKGSLGQRYGELPSLSGEPGITQNGSVEMLSDIEVLAKKSNLQITDIRTQFSDNASDFKENLVRLKTEGDMESYLKFFYNLESPLLLMDVKKFRLSVKSSFGLLEGDLLISQNQLD